MDKEGKIFGLAESEAMAVLLVLAAVFLAQALIF